MELDEGPMPTIEGEHGGHANGHLGAIFEHNRRLVGSPSHRTVHPGLNVPRSELKCRFPKLSVQDLTVFIVVSPPLRRICPDDQQARITTDDVAEDVRVGVIEDPVKASREPPELLRLLHGPCTPTTPGDHFSILSSRPRARASPQNARRLPGEFLDARLQSTLPKTCLQCPAAVTALVVNGKVRATSRVPAHFRPGGNLRADARSR